MSCQAISAKMIPALSLLLEAHQYAEQTSGKPWEFAVEIEQLNDLGISPNDLRWLIRMQFVQHAHEVTVQGDNSRDFRPTGDLTFTKNTCFVLTPVGVKTALKNCNSKASNGATQSEASGNQNGSNTIDSFLLPKWDTGKRELTIGGQLVKRFKWHAMNQEAILATFEEDGWPARIDDPLSPHPEQDSKRRLSDTIKCLNRKQQNQLLHFRGDGTGEGVTWELVEPNGSNGSKT